MCLLRGPPPPRAYSNTRRHGGYHGEGETGPCSVAVVIVIPALTQRMPLLKFNFNMKYLKKKRELWCWTKLKKTPDILHTTIKYPIMRHSLFARGRAEEDKEVIHGKKNVRKTATRNLIMALCVRVCVCACVSERSNKGSICISINQAAASAPGPAWIHLLLRLNVFTETYLCLISPVSGLVAAQLSAARLRHGLYEFCPLDLLLAAPPRPPINPSHATFECALWRVTITAGSPSHNIKSFMWQS